jgi:hypothetical protein
MDPSNPSIRQTYVWSTSKAIREASSGASLATPSVKSSHQDLDRDGVPERWNITMRVRKPVLNKLPSNLAAGTVVVAFEYETSNVAKI